MKTPLPPDLEPIYLALYKYLQKLAEIYDGLSKHLPKIELNGQPPYTAFRFDESNHTDTVACYLKGMKAVSSLNACMILLQAGHAQEIGALCRIVDDMCNEILFLIKPGLETSLDPHQEKFLDAFYQEEFTDISDLLQSHQPRDTLSIRKIHATVANHMASIVNQSEAQSMATVMHKTLSGYVHGAYPQIMEMYGGNPPHFHMFGMPNTQRVYEWFSQIQTYIDRLILITILVARKMQAKEIALDAQSTKEQFELQFDTREDRTPEEMLKAAKNPLKS